MEKKRPAKKTAKAVPTGNPGFRGAVPAVKKAKRATPTGNPGMKMRAPKR